MTLSPLESAITHVESGGDTYAIGDKHLKDKAYGPMQIRLPCVKDVRQYAGVSIYVDEKGKSVEITPENCLGNFELSVWIFRNYMARYVTEKRLGRPPTDEDRARCWNGGPNGYKKQSTVKYWVKVEKALQAII